MNIPALDAGRDGAFGAPAAAGIARGVCRLLADMGYAALTEFTLKCGRRADVIGLDRAGRFAIVEIKSSVADFQADRKWHDYRPFCDAFYFAVGAGFPLRLLPADCGLIVADAYEGAVARPALAVPLNGARRKALVLRFALTATHRLQGLLDPR